MAKTLKVTSLFIVSILFCFLSYKLCYFIAEKYFFDKFFYQKSASYGYWPNINVDNRDKYSQAIRDNNQQIFSSPNGVFTVAIIGDSYVRGVGIKDNQRFAKILEKKLNKIHPTKVIDIGEMGDGTINFLKKYQILNEFNPLIDLYIFSLVSNDSLIKSLIVHTENYSCFPDTDIMDIMKNCQQKFPKEKIVYDPNCELNQQHVDFNNQEYVGEYYHKNAEASWQNPINNCVMRSSLQKLPTDKAIYFITDDYYGDYKFYTLYRQLLNEAKKFILSSNIGSSIPQYKPYFRLDKNVSLTLRVSLQESHPSVLANQMYADILFNEITTNPKWNFVK